MAGIDKTYVSEWKGFVAIRDWAKSVGTITFKGAEFTPYDWLYYPDITEEEFEKNKRQSWEEAKERYAQPDGKECFKYYLENYGEDFINNPRHFFSMVVWNTSTQQDVILIKYCPLEVIKNTLHDQYSEDFIKKVENGTSEYDTFERNGQKHPHIGVVWNINSRFKDRRIWWWIRIETPEDDVLYNETTNQWFFEHEMANSQGWITTVCTKYHGPMSMRKVRRIIAGWNLPRGTKINFEGSYHNYVMKDFTVTIK